MLVQFNSIEDQPVLLTSGRIDELVDAVLAPEETDAEVLEEGALVVRVVVEGAEQDVWRDEDEVAEADDQNGPGHLKFATVQLFLTVFGTEEKLDC